MATEARFQKGFKEEATDEPGIVLGDDGAVLIVRPGGERFDPTAPPDVTLAGDLTVESLSAGIISGTDVSASDRIAGHDVATGRWVKLDAAVGPDPDVDEDGIANGTCYLYFDQYQGALYMKGRLNDGTLFSHRLAVVP